MGGKRATIKDIETMGRMAAEEQKSLTDISRETGFCAKTVMTCLKLYRKKHGLSRQQMFKTATAYLGEDDDDEPNDKVSDAAMIESDATPQVTEMPKDEDEVEEQDEEEQVEETEKGLKDTKKEEPDPFGNDDLEVLPDSKTVDDPMKMPFDDTGMFEIGGKEWLHKLDVILHEMGVEAKRRRFLLGSIRDSPRYQNYEGMLMFFNTIKGLQGMKAQVIADRLFGSMSRQQNGMGQMGMQNPFGQMGPSAPNPYDMFAQPNYGYGQQQGISIQQFQMEMQRMRMEERQRYEEARRREEEKRKEEEFKSSMMGALQELKKQVENPNPQATGQVIEYTEPVRNEQGQIVDARVVKLPRDLYEKKLMDDMREREINRTLSISQGKTPEDSESMKLLRQQQEDLKSMLNTAKLEMDRIKEEARQKEMASEKERMELRIRQTEDKYATMVKDMERNMHQMTERMSQQAQMAQANSGRTDPQITLAMEDMRNQFTKTVKLIEMGNQRMESMGTTVRQLLMGDPNRPKNAAPDQWSADDTKKFEQATGGQ